MEEKDIDAASVIQMQSYLQRLFAIEPTQVEGYNRKQSDFPQTNQSPDNVFATQVQHTRQLISAWDLPSPQDWKEGWALFCTAYLAQKMNIAHEPLPGAAGRSAAIARALLELFELYNEPFFANTIYFMTLFYRDDYHDPDKLIWCMSAAAEHDLLPFFSERGICAHHIDQPITGVAFDNLLKKAELGFLPKVRPKILVDQTHSYNFETYHLAYFLKEYGFLGIHSDRSLRKNIFQRLDVLVTHQDVVAVPYTAEEMAEIIEFVRQGGGVMLMGNGETFARYANQAELNGGEFPINQLAHIFGFEFSTKKAAGRLSAHPDMPEFMVSPFHLDIPHTSTVTILKNGQPVLSDETQQPVIAIGEYGMGRVAVVGGTYLSRYLDYLPIKRLLAALFNWLGEKSPNIQRYVDQNTAALFPDIRMHQGWDYELEMKPELKRRYIQRADFIWPENEVNINGIQILYAESMKTKVGHIVDELYPRVYQALRDFYQCEPLSESVKRIHFYPHWGSGYTWMPPLVQPAIIGIPCLGKNPDLILGIFSHEMTHAWGLPGPPGWEHCWTTFTDQYFAEQLDLYGAEQRAQSNESRWQKLFAADPELDKIDISGERRDSIVAEHLRWAKFSYMFNELCEKYGNELLAKYIRLFRKYGTTDKESLSMTDFIRYLSLAAGADLFPYFIEKGTQVKPQEIKFDKYK